jgi:hypothetical protein
MTFDPETGAINTIRPTLEGIDPVDPVDPPE